VYQFLIKPLGGLAEWEADHSSTNADENGENLAANSKERNTPLDFVREKVRETLDAAGDNTANKYKGVHICL